MSDDRARALEAVLKLTALDERTAELKASLERIERKLEVLVDRLSKVEANYQRLERRESTAEAAQEAAATDADRPFLTVISEE